MDKGRQSGITGVKTREEAREEMWKAIKWTVSQAANIELLYCGGGAGGYGRLPTEDEQWRIARRRAR